MSCVYVVDDDPSVLKATSRLLRATGFDVRPFQSAVAYLEQFDADAAGCLVLDLNMPAVNGLQLQQALAQRGGAPAIIFLSGQADVPKSVEAMKGGAVEFLTKPVVPEVLLDAIRGALERSDTAMRTLTRIHALQERYESLSRREREVMGLLVRGRLNKQVGGELGISEITVKAHRGRMMRKMHASSFAELVTMAASLRGDLRASINDLAMPMMS